MNILSSAGAFWLPQENLRPAIATLGIYDVNFPRPPNLSIQECNERGLWVNQSCPSAWESENHCIDIDNAGNLVWSYGAYSVIDPSQNLLFNHSVAFQYPSKASSVYIVTGPLLHTEKNINTRRRADHILEFLERVKKPVAIVGIGVQSAISHCSKQLSEHSRKFLESVSRHISKYGGFVGLRGACTMQLVRGAGFAEGFHSLGCPSLFINKREDLGVLLERKYRSLHSKILSPEGCFKIGFVTNGEPMVGSALLDVLKNHGLPGSIHIIKMGETKVLLPR